eukprot:9139390-Karenia_brevis.AAC.3
MMCVVTFRTSDGKMHEASIPKLTTLRDLQPCLCAKFNARFPAMQANLEVGGRMFNDFDDMPFAHFWYSCQCENPLCDPKAASTCAKKLEACVTFERNTTNPFWFDWIDRRAPKITLAEEVAYDKAAELGETNLSLRAWLQERRASELRLPVIEGFPM